AFKRFYTSDDHEWYASHGVSQGGQSASPKVVPAPWGKVIYNDTVDGNVETLRWWHNWYSFAHWDIDTSTDNSNPPHQITGRRRHYLRAMGGTWHEYYEPVTGYQTACVQQSDCSGFVGGYCHPVTNKCE